ncbi:EscU/YscU/HrcU family type III secretion system export apparatus switch protein [Kordiimonas marina]|uniref:EscU/YscU/HrcU family type III secretion system export apparatus switch protein n=1 Tax=Kordiimonas marina TaxID=2872312 RepID=UPI001FF3AD7E|nr:EscU/YscU/HrcU family type III secretion system export apparatus switch protein [Kordiimonas marina]MCJ9429027.1 EscU/YscU/HrcU family type III secretion system export apparatus switch protein [Kordiimonas marina]
MNDTNDIPTPTTKAVAVKRGADSDTPRITAKGHGYVAEKILDIAFAEGVKVRQDKDLTDLLDAFEVESPVPLEALQAVSMILERVYNENSKMEAAAGSEDQTKQYGTTGRPPLTTPLAKPSPEDGNSNDQ